MSKKTVITAGGTVSLGEVWKHRHVLKHLVVKDLTVRYKQMLLGAGWVLLQPIIEVLAFTLVFRGVFSGTSELPYMAFVFVGVMLWTYFAATVQRIATCIVGHGNLLKRLYFPRSIIPLSVAMSRCIDLLITFGALLVLLHLSEVPLSLTLLWVLPLFALLVLCAIGIGMLLCTVHVRYRDVGLTVPYILRVGMFLTPVIYPLSILPEKWQTLIAINPLTGIMVSFRAVVAGHPPVMDQLLQTSITVTLALFLSGTLLFLRAEKTFLDEL